MRGIRLSPMKPLATSESSYYIMFCTLTYFKVATIAAKIKIYPNNVLINDKKINIISNSIFLYFQGVYRANESTSYVARGCRETGFARILRHSRGIAVRKRRYSRCADKPAIFSGPHHSEAEARVRRGRRQKREVTPYAGCGRVERRHACSARSRRSLFTTQR